MLKALRLLLHTYLLISLDVIAQPADTVYLTPHQVPARTASSNPGAITYEVDSAILDKYQGLPLPELLRKTTPLYIRDYGPGTLSTMSLRGSGSSHTVVLWNGLPLSQPQVGLADIALLPVHSSTRIKVESGGGSAWYGGGAIGGIISLDSDPLAVRSPFAEGSVSQGSFGRSIYYAGLGTGKPGAGLRVDGFYRNAENNYPFINTTETGNPVDTLTNAAQLAYGVNLAGGLYLNEHLKLTLHSSASNTVREIPPQMTSRISFAQQTDAHLRNILKLTHHGKRFETSISAGSGIDRLLYVDTLKDINSSNLSANSIVALNEKFMVKNQQVSMGFLFNDQRVNNSNFNNERAVQQSLSFYAHTVRELKKLFSVHFSGRAEQVFGGPLALSGYLGISRRWFKKIETNAGVGRVYRLPTLNDRFWQPGGNPDLLPEAGYTADGNLSVKFSKDFKISSGIYYHLIDNWIQWVPGSNGLFHPENVKKVQAKGTEVLLQYQKKWRSWEIHLQGNYSFTLSTVQRTYVGSISSEGSQLIYMPYNKGGGVATLEWKSFSLFYACSATGFVFTDPANTKYLDGYVLSDAGFSISLKKVPFAPEAVIRVFNLMDQSYQAIEYNPMPGRNVLFTLNFKI